MSFAKILIANRGEIACRVLRSALRLGYRTVAVYSDADADAPHVTQADEALRIGPAPAADSYLNIDALLAAAKRSGADAVHPGYGFLSERADFAQACLDAGLVFIGPPPAALRALGDKAAAKRLMQAAGVPCAPGFSGADPDDAELIAAAEELGAPLLVKAVAGGGGRGMRVVHDLTELPAALQSARREALGAFGDGALMLERLIENGRHVEVQVFADAHGHAVHLGERDCTAQRRRQKVVEEAPSPSVDDALRARLGHDAVTAALAAGYQGAGTVEFIVDAERRHYFLEVNARLQVEHPVTECLTGLDLVEWQLRVAAGETLPMTQDEIRFEGHAIEARLYAEDPYAGFSPQTGAVLDWRPERAGVRVDTGIGATGEVTPHYDALLAKFVAHGRDRDDALRRLRRALDDAPLFGPQTNARFLRDLLHHPQFVDARMATTRLDEWAAAGAPLLQRPAPTDDAWRIAAALLGGTGATFELALRCDGALRTLRVPVPGVRIDSVADGLLRCEVDGLRRKLPCHVDGRAVQLAIDAAVFRFSEPSPWPRQEAADDAGSARAPVAGILRELRVAVGDAVVAGQPLACVEAMKMEMWLNARAAGRVRALRAAAGDAVAAAAVLIEIDLQPTTPE